MPVRRLRHLPAGGDAVLVNAGGRRRKVGLEKIPATFVEAGRRRGDELGHRLPKGRRSHVAGWFVEDRHDGEVARALLAGYPSAPPRG